MLCLQLVLLLSLGTLVVRCHEKDDDIDKETGTEVEDSEETSEKKSTGETSEDEDLPPREDPHRDPSLCEVCKYLTNEVKVRLAETGKTHEVLETGYALENKKKKDYRKSELRLIEVINDPHVCDKILEYNVHAERKGSLRFAKGRSQTMDTLHNLVHKGVNVELGIPYEMWDTPSSGVTEMQRQCFKIVEVYEEIIEDWYWNYQDQDFTTFLCQERVLKEDDQQCLSEAWSEEEYRKKKEKEEKEYEKLQAKRRKEEKLKKKSGFKGEIGNEEPDRDEL